MCRPSYYTVAYEINPWMRVTRRPDHARATHEWEQLHRLLTRTLGVRVRLLPPHRAVPDLVFTANAGLVCGRTVVLSRFRFPERQREEPFVARYFRRAGYRIVPLPARYNFEGEGDALWMGDTLVLGFRFRSSAPVHAQLARILRRRVLPVELVDRRFYHLDTCFCPLDARTALWYPKAFDRYGRRALEHVAEELIPVTEREAARFVCNTIAVGRDLVMPAGSSASLRRRLGRHGFRLHSVELSEFLKAGGAAKCLALWLTPQAGLSAAPCASLRPQKSQSDFGDQVSPDIRRMSGGFNPGDAPHLSGPDMLRMSRGEASVGGRQARGKMS